MPKSRGVHRVYIINEDGRDPVVYPKVLPVGRGEHVLFVAVGGREHFHVRPNTSVFQSIEKGEDIPVELGSPPTCTIRPDVRPNSVHRYDVSSGSYEKIDPILIIYESVAE